MLRNALIKHGFGGFFSQLPVESRPILIPNVSQRVVICSERWCTFYEVSGCHCGEFEDDSLLGYSAL
jgi:hypothetical protein